MRWRQKLQTVGGADLIIGQPMGLEVCGALVELSSIPEAGAVHHQVVVEMLRVHMGLDEVVVLPAVHFAGLLLGGPYLRPYALGGTVPPGHQFQIPPLGLQLGEHLAQAVYLQNLLA